VEWARIESSLQISNILHLSIFSPVFLESWSSSLENLATCGSEANCFKQGFLSYTRKVVARAPASCARRMSWRCGLGTQVVFCT
jgi:hypothetical protein